MAARRTDVHQLQEVVRLHRLGVSQRRIARDLRMSRTMIGRAQEVFGGAGLLEGEPSALPDLADLRRVFDAAYPPKTAPQQVSSVAGWRDDVERLRKRGARPTSIHDWLRLNKEDYTGSLYDALGRMTIALKFNEMVRNGDIGPVLLGRDHHDTGGTDSPFRETANIKDGSNIMADMATHCFAGNAARGMSLVALHNGGGVGIGKAVNGGFGLVLDGSERIDSVIKQAIPWDVMGGVARRAWARNDNSIETAIKYNDMRRGSDHITLPFLTDENMVENLVTKAFNKRDLS